MASPTVPGLTSATKPSTTTNLKPNRLPAPTLFVGPPSRNTSQLSLARPPITREKSARARVPTTTTTAADETLPPTATTRDLPPVTLRKLSTQSIDAKWRSMQSTLNEVELTAQSSTHVFGAAHAAALDELRNAQIALARAWGRGNEVALAADREEGASEAGTVNMRRFQEAEVLAGERRRDAGAGSMLRGRGRAGTEDSASTVLSDESVASSQGSATGGSAGGRSALEDETAQDIRLASERRAANEEYFVKVDQGVKEVVEKLEKVAEAMRGVEGESRSLWGGSSVSSGVEGEGEGKDGAGVGSSDPVAGG